jgi:hypothetical protein
MPWPPEHPLVRRARPDPPARRGHPVRARSPASGPKVGKLEAVGHRQAGSPPARGRESRTPPAGQPANPLPARRRARRVPDLPPIVVSVVVGRRVVPLPTVMPGAARVRARRVGGHRVGGHRAAGAPAGGHRPGGAAAEEGRRGRDPRAPRRRDDPLDRREPTIGRRQDLPVRRWCARGGGAWPAGGPVRFATPQPTVGVRAGPARTLLAGGDRPGRRRSSSPSDGRVPTTVGAEAPPSGRGTRPLGRSGRPPSCRPTSPRSWPPPPVLTGVNCGTG